MWYYVLAEVDGKRTWFPYGLLSDALDKRDWLHRFNHPAVIIQSPSNVYPNLPAKE